MRFLEELIYKSIFLKACFIVAVIIVILTLLVGIMPTSSILIAILTLVSLGACVFLYVVTPIILIIIVIKEKITRGKKV